MYLSMKKHLLKHTHLLTGIGSVMEILPSRRITLPSLERSDAENLQSDWAAVGQDFQTVIRRLPQNVEKITDNWKQTARRNAASSLQKR